MPLASLKPAVLLDAVCIDGCEGDGRHTFLVMDGFNCMSETVTVTFETVTKDFKNIKSIAPSLLPLYQHFNNLKLLHRRTVHNKLLFKMGISETVFSEKQKQLNIFILNVIRYQKTGLA